MTLCTSTNPSPGAHRHQHRASTSSSLAGAPTPPSSVHEETPEGSPCARPFDRWKPQGGGSEQDIFRRFKILAADEEAFLTHWARKRLTCGIFARDENGTLEFRISPANISDLAALDISRSGFSVLEPQWRHVYDGEGVSWLAQSRCVDFDNYAPNIFDSSGRPIFVASQLGHCGPSGLAVHEFWHRNAGNASDNDRETARDRENCLVTKYAGKSAVGRQ